MLDDGVTGGYQERIMVAMRHEVARVTTHAVRESFHQARTLLMNARMQDMCRRMSCSALYGGANLLESADLYDEIAGRVSGCLPSI